MAKKRANGEGSIRRTHGVFHQAIGAAMREGLVARNPTEVPCIRSRQTGQRYRLCVFAKPDPPA